MLTCDQKCLLAMYKTFYGKEYQPTDVSEISVQQHTQMQAMRFILQHAGAGPYPSGYGFALGQFCPVSMLLEEQMRQMDTVLADDVRNFYAEYDDSKIFTTDTKYSGVLSKDDKIDIQNISADLRIREQSNGEVMTKWVSVIASLLYKYNMLLGSTPFDIVYEKLLENFSSMYDKDFAFEAGKSLPIAGLV